MPGCQVHPFSLVPAYLQGISVPAIFMEKCGLKVYSGQAPGQEASSIFRLVLSASLSPLKMPVKVIYLVTLSAILLNLTGKVPAYMCLFSSTFNWYYFIISFLLPAFIEHCQIGPCAQLLSHVQLFATPWTVARQAPLSMEFSRQKYWDGLHWLLQGTFLNQR